MASDVAHEGHLYIFGQHLYTLSLLSATGGAGGLLSPLGSSATLSSPSYASQHRPPSVGERTYVQLQITLKGNSLQGACIAQWPCMLECDEECHCSQFQHFVLPQGMVQLALSPGDFPPLVSWN